LAHVHTQGLLQHAPGYDASVLAARDVPRLREAVIAWRLGSDKRLLAQVDAIPAAFNRLRTDAAHLKRHSTAFRPIAISWLTPP